MAAPSATARSTPGGIKLDDGFSTKLTIAADVDISFWEKTVQPPGIDGGDAIETSTMHNTTWRTMSPRALRTLTPLSVTAAYDPAVFSQLVSVTNLETTITVTFPDGSTLAFYGYVQNTEPSDNTEGEQPELTVTIQPTNQDPSTGSEEAPVLVEVAGT